MLEHIRMPRRQARSNTTNRLNLSESPARWKLQTYDHCNSPRKPTTPSAKESKTWIHRPRANTNQQENTQRKERNPHIQQCKHVRLLSYPFSWCPCCNGVIARSTNKRHRLIWSCCTWTHWNCGLWEFQSVPHNVAIGVRNACHHCDSHTNWLIEKTNEEDAYLINRGGVKENANVIKAKPRIRYIWEDPLHTGPPLTFGVGRVMGGVFGLIGIVLLSKFI